VEGAAVFSGGDTIESECCTSLNMDKQVLLAGNFLSHANKPRQICEELALRLPAVGWRVLCASRKTNRMARLLDMTWTAWRNRREYSVAQVDVFSGPSFFWAEAVCWTLSRIGKPYVLTLHGGRLPQFGRRRPRRVGRLLRSAIAVTAPSGYLQDQMQSYRDDVLLLPNPLELDNYQFVARRRIQPELIWLRSFESLYNPSLAIRVLASLAPQFPEASLTMVGPDRGDGSLGETRRLAMELGVIDRSIFTGGVTKAEVPVRISQGDIFLNTTNVDNMPISVLEAMACGLCVVSTNVGGIPYLLEHECDSLLVPPNDPQAMTAAVSRILTEPALVERLSQNARKKAEQCDWSAILPQWDSLLTTVAEGRRP